LTEAPVCIPGLALEAGVLGGTRGVSIVVPPVAAPDEQGPEVGASGLQAGHSAAVCADLDDVDADVGATDQLPSGPCGASAARLARLRGVNAPEAHGDRLPVGTSDVIGESRVWARMAYAQASRWYSGPSPTSLFPNRTCGFPHISALCEAFP